MLGGWPANAGIAEVGGWMVSGFHCDGGVSGLYAREGLVSRVPSLLPCSKVRTKASGEVGDMGEGVKVSGSGLGDVGGEEREMDLWDAVSLSSKKSSSSAKGLGFSVTGFCERGKRASVMISQPEGSNGDGRQGTPYSVDLSLGLAQPFELHTPLSTSTTTAVLRPSFSSLPSFLSFPKFRLSTHA